MGREIFSTDEIIEILNSQLPEGASKKFNFKEVVDALSLVSGDIRVAFDVPEDAGAFTIGPRRVLEIMPVNINYRPPVDPERMGQYLQQGRAAVSRLGTDDAQAVSKKPVADSKDKRESSAANKFRNIEMLGRLDRLVHGVPAPKEAGNDEPPSIDALMDDLAAITQVCETIAEEHPDMDSIAYSAFKMQILEGLTLQETALRLKVEYPRYDARKRVTSKGYGAATIQKYTTECYQLIVRHLSPGPEAAGSLAVRESMAG